MAIVPSSLSNIGSEVPYQIGKPTSSLRVSYPLAKTLNHVLGYRLTGVRHFQTCVGDPASDGPIGRIYTYRNPNADYVDLVFRLKCNIINFAASVAADFGGATTQTQSFFGAGDHDGWYCLRLPCEDKTGAQIITIYCTNVTIATALVYDVPRTTLSAGDDRVEFTDSVSPACGLTEGRYITDSTLAGTDAVGAAVRAAWYNNHRQAVSWWAKEDTDARNTAAGAYTNLFDSFEFVHQGRQRLSTDTVRAYKAKYRVKVTGGSTYKIRVNTSIGGSAAESAALNNPAYAFYEDDIDVSCTVADSITIEGKITAGVGTIYLGAFSVYEA